VSIARASSLPTPPVSMSYPSPSRVACSKGGAELAATRVAWTPDTPGYASADRASKKPSAARSPRVTAPSAPMDLLIGGMVLVVVSEVVVELSPGVVSPGPAKPDPPEQAVLPRNTTRTRGMSRKEATVENDDERILIGRGNASQAQELAARSWSGSILRRPENALPPRRGLYGLGSAASWDPAAA